MRLFRPINVFRDIGFSAVVNSLQIGRMKEWQSYRAQCQAQLSPEACLFAHRSLDVGMHVRGSGVQALLPLFCRMASSVV